MSSNHFGVSALFVIGLSVLVRGELVCGVGKATVRGRCYEEEVLFSGSYTIRNLHVDRQTNLLYFKYDVTPFTEILTARYFDLTTKELGVIPEVPDVAAYAVDQDRHDVYVGGNGCIYKFHYNNKTIERMGCTGRYRLLSISYGHELYYTNGYVYTMINGESATVEDMNGTTTLTYVIDEDGYRYYSDFRGLYGKMRGSENEAVFYKRGDFRDGVKMDSSGMPYICKNSDLYFVNKHTEALEKIGTLNDYCIDLVFDKDNNIMYSNGSQIKKLKAVQMSVVRNNDE